MINTGAKIKEILYLKKITQTQLAEKLGIHKQSLTVWLNGNKNPKIETLAKIAKVLEVPLSSLIEENPDTSNDISNNTPNGIPNNAANNNQNKTENDLSSKIELLEEKNKRFELEISLLKKDNETLKKELAFLKETLNNSKQKH